MYCHVVVGPFAGRGNRNGYVIGMGTSAASNATGDQHIAIGTDSGRDISGGVTVAIGNEAGASNTGYYNILLGYRAGYNATINETFVAKGSLPNALLYGDMYNGKLSIGKNSASDYNLDVSGSGRFIGDLRVTGTLSTNTIVVFGSNTLYSQGSSIFTGATVFTSTPAIGNTASTIITVDQLVSTVASLLNQPFTQQAQTYTF